MGKTRFGHVAAATMVAAGHVHRTWQQHVDPRHRQYESGADHHVAAAAAVGLQLDVQRDVHRGLERYVPVRVRICSTTTTPTTTTPTTTTPPTTTPTTTLRTSTTTTRTSTPSAAACSASYRVASTWPGYAQAAVTVKAVKPVTSWTASFDLPAGAVVEQSWSAQVTQSGQRVTATSYSWNGTLGGLLYRVRPDHQGRNGRDPGADLHQPLNRRLTDGDGGDAAGDRRPGRVGGG